MTIIIIITLFFSAVHSLPTHHNHRTAVNYLTKYGYMREKENVSEMREVEGALRNMQEFLGLKQSGKLDETTLNEMFRPRCGMSDDKSENFGKRYLARGKWDRNELTYKIENYPTNHIDLQDKSMVDKQVALALKDWSDIANLKFTRVGKDQKSDIKFAFLPKDHGDGELFDNLTLAHAFYPSDGRVHFNNDMPWTYKTRNLGYYLRQVVTHEMGHSLGLGHSNIFGSIMYPTYYAWANEYLMHADDIAGMVSLYGEAKYHTSPLNKNSSEPEASTSKPTNKDTTKSLLNVFTFFIPNGDNNNSPLNDQTAVTIQNPKTTKYHLDSSSSFIAAVTKYNLIWTVIIYLLF